MKIKASVFSPVHISNTNVYQKNFNLIKENEYVYIFDEFKIMKYFIQNKYGNDYVKLFNIKKREIIEKNLYVRKIESCFDTDEIFSFIVSQNKVYIPGSSIKGALRTTILDDLFTKHKITKKNITSAFDKKIVNIFHKLTVRDVYTDFDTVIYKSLNIKKDKNKQKSRRKNPEYISNFYECIDKGIFEINITDKNNFNIPEICNKYFLPKLEKETQVWFCDINFKNKALNLIKDIKANNKIFVLNIGRFGGAEQKTVDTLRYIPSSHCKDKSKTSTYTYGIKKEVNSYDDSLLPFGWLLCELK